MAIDLSQIKLERDEIIVSWFNNYSGVLVKTPTTTIIIDPTEVNPLDFGKVDVVLITHEHFDHLDENIVKGFFERNRKCSVVADKTSAERLSEFIPADNLSAVDAGDKTDFGPVTVYSEHSEHPATTPLSYVIVSENGRVIYHTSDSAPFIGMKKIGQVYKPDITFCTVGIAPGATPQTGAEIAEFVKPKLAIPYHGPRLEDFVKVLAKKNPKLQTKILKIKEMFKYV
jgi:L-ascorbate metabolism protein UlaG (beta-lactamase superfamily)